MEDGFERAVAVTGDPSATEAARAAALAFFEGVCQHPDGWRFCLEKFLAAQTDDVRFCCLQLLQLELERGRLGPAAACVIRESLVSASVTVLPRAHCGPAVLNKCAQLLVRAACLLPPAEWPAARRPAPRPRRCVRVRARPAPPLPRLFPGRCGRPSSIILHLYQC